MELYELIGVKALQEKNGTQRSMLLRSDLMINDCLIAFPVPPKCFHEQLKTETERCLFSNLLFFLWYVQTCNKRRAGFLSSQHDNKDSRPGWKAVEMFDVSMRKSPATRCYW